MFVGEGPGFNEDQQGRPFVGRAGQLLDDMIEAVPMKRADVFITNVVKCRPPDNRDPQPDEIETCWPYLEAQIALIRPRVIATLGRHSLSRFFPEAKISRDHGRILQWRSTVVFPLYHPAAALRSGAVMEALAADFKKVPQAVIESLRLAASRKPGPPPFQGVQPQLEAAAQGRPTAQAPSRAAESPPPADVAGAGRREQGQLSMF
jgi:DNA polymerase